MMSKVFDAFVALIFNGVTAFSAVGFYNLVKREGLIQVSKGLSSTYVYSQRLTGEHFDWEK